MDGTDLILPDDIPTILTAPIRLSIQPGLTLRQIVDLAELPEEVTSRLILILNGAPARDWDHVLTLDGDILELMIIPSGGDNGGAKAVISSLAIIAISIAAPYLAASILSGGFIAGGLGAASAAVASIGWTAYALTAGITLVGTMAISALIKPDGFGAGTRSYNSASEDPAYQIRGQSNEARPYGTVPRLYGTTRYYPLLASTPYFSNVGKKSSMVALYDYGIGTVDITNTRVGNQDIEQLAPQTYLHQNTLATGTTLKLVAKVPDYAELSEQLAQNVDFIIQTHEESINATLDVYFPGGLASIDANGNRNSRSVTFVTEWRLAGDTGWNRVPSTSYKGVTVNTQAWVYDTRYDIAGGNYWAVTTSRTAQGNYPTSELTLVRDGVVIYDATSTNYSVSNPGIDYRTVTEKDLNVPYKRGASKGSVPNWGGQYYATRAYYEIMVPRADTYAPVTIAAATLVPFVCSIQMQFPAAGTYDLKITRTSPVTSPDTSGTVTQVDMAVVSMVTSFHGGKVVNLKRRHTLYEMLFSATDTLNSTVDGVNSICSAWLRGVSASGWTTLVQSANPALIALDIATGPACHKPLNDAQIDFPSWFAFAQRCDEDVTTKLNGNTYVTKRHEWHGVIDTDITAQNAIDAVLSIGRAARTTTASGKFGVLMDIPKSDYRQLITPANSWGFEGNRTFTPIPDGFRVAFVDAANDYMPREVIAYRDGKDDSNAVTLEDLPTWGITNVAQAWRHGRYMLAQGLLRSETFSVYMDVENLAFGRGDLVLMQHDIPQFGGMAARITTTDGAQIISVNRPLELGAGNYTIRLASGPIIQGKILSQIDSVTYRLDKVTGAASDDLIVLGDATTNASPYIVMSIEAGEDLTAHITLVAYNPGVYTADEGDIPDWNPNFGDAVDQTTNVAVKITSLAYAWVFDDGIPYAEVTIKWTPTKATYAYVGADVSLTTGAIKSVIGQITKAGSGSLSYRIPFNDAGYFNHPITFGVRPKSVSGLRGVEVTQAITLVPYDSTPLPPSNFSLDAHGAALTLSWHPSISKDILVYILRYTPDTVNPTWTTSQFLDRVEGKLTSSVQPVRAGTYMLRAMNVIGKQSDILTLRLPMADIPNMIPITVLDDGPTWPGTKDGFQQGYFPPDGLGMQVLLIDKTTLVIATMTGVTDYNVKLLDGTFIYVGAGDAISSNYLVSNVTWKSDLSVQAIYTSPTITDLGGIFEAHVQANMLVGVVGKTETRELSAVQGYGITPFTARDTRAVDTSQYDSGWSVWLEYRTKGASADAWGNWTRLTAGIVTGRYFQFRIIGSASNNAAMIVVYNGKITMNFVGRNWMSLKLTVPAAGLVVPFVPAFYQPPSVSVAPASADDGPAGYSVESVTRSQVKIKVLQPGTATAIAGTAFVTATGYGTERSAAI